ncbi:MAG: PAS domain S-box protein [Desulfobacterales bacterium]|nr:PAS domain S-box protein [Desulfobacterales bacterium]
MTDIQAEPISEMKKSHAALKREIQTPDKTEKHIKEAPQEMEHLIASLPTILIGLSREDKVVLWNAKAEKVFNKAAAHVMGLSLNQCNINWDWDKIAAGINQSLAEYCPVRVDDILFQGPDGAERYLGLTIKPLDGDENRVLGLIIIGADITDRKKLETQLQQSQKMEAIGQLAAGIAHEINTPTQFVGDNTRFFQEAFDDLFQIISEYGKLREAVKSKSMTSELVQKVENRIEEIDLDYLEEEIPIALQHTLKGIKRIAKIVQAMRIFAHPGMVDKEPTDLNKEIEKTITITRNEWKYVAELTTDFDPSLPVVPCFRAELNQVILNLIVNAAHAVSELHKENSNCKGTIRISTHHERGWAKIHISDTGVGIPEEIRHKIFDLFFTTKEPGKGTGQGLAISHSVIVDKHNGTLDLEIQEGKGTTFIIGLPLGADQEQNE